MKKLLSIIFYLLCMSTNLVHANSIDPSFSSADPGDYSININTLASFVDVTDGVTGATTNTYNLSGLLGANVGESIGGSGPRIVFNFSQLITSLPAFDSLPFDALVDTFASYNYVEFSGFNSISCVHGCDDRLYFGGFDGSRLIMDYYRGNYNPPVFDPDDPFSFTRFDYHFHFEGSVSAVPAPPAFWLFITGLLGLVHFAKKQH